MAASTLQMRDPTAVQEGWHQITQGASVLMLWQSCSRPHQQSPKPRSCCLLALPFAVKVAALRVG